MDSEQEMSRTYFYPYVLTLLISGVVSEHYIGFVASYYLGFGNGDGIPLTLVPGTVAGSILVGFLSKIGKARK